jgi:hypothetical protein
LVSSNGSNSLLSWVLAAGDEHVQRQAVVVDEQVVLGAGFAPVSGVRAGQLAPLFARTDTASMLARDQSSSSASESSSSTS